MARTKAKDGKAATEGDRERNEAAKAEAQLRDYYDLSRRILDLIKGGTFDKATQEKLSRETGKGVQALRAIRPFARAYTPEQLDELCELRTRKGQALPWGYVCDLIPASDPKERAELQRRAAQEGWSRSRLRAEIPEKYKRLWKSRQGGRPFSRSKDLREGLDQIVQYGKEWLGRCRAWTQEGWYKDEPRTAVKGELQKRLEAAQKTLRQIQEVVGELEERLKRVPTQTGDRRAAQSEAQATLAQAVPRRRTSRRPG